MATKRSKAELIELLVALADSGDIELAHKFADDLLVEFIDDEEITEAYNDVAKWYA